MVFDVFFRRLTVVDRCRLVWSLRPLRC
jgi:hypothetical protein